MGDEGKLVKMEKDFSPEVDVALPQAKQLLKSSGIAKALEPLTLLEKQTRNGFDLASNTRLLLAITELCFEAGDWKLLQDQITVLSKKHGLLKQAITKMIQYVVTLVDKTPDSATKLEFIDTLRTVTDGKIYVEIEKARLTRILAGIREKEGKVNEAADILQELQVETFGSMEKREKTDFILEQMRLNLARKDYVRTQIIANKINTKYFANKDVQDLKLRFYELMIQHALHEGDYLTVCKNYQQVYTTPSVLEDEAKFSEILRYIVLFVVLAPFSNEQSDILHKVAIEKNLEKLPLYKNLVEAFIQKELMRWSKIQEMYGEELQKGFVFSQSDKDGVARWNDFHSRVNEHNIRIIAQYYHRITLQRMVELLDLPMKETEEFVSKLVTSGTITAKIDRISGIVTFTAARDPIEEMNAWSKKVHDLLDLVNTTTHLIAKEEMVNKIKKASATNLDQ